MSVCNNFGIYLLVSTAVLCLTGYTTYVPTNKPSEVDAESLLNVAKGKQRQSSLSVIKEEDYSFPKRLRNAIKPNIVFESKSDENSATEVLVQLDENSKVISVRMQLSSGNAEWDKAVIAAVWK